MPEDNKIVSTNVDTPKEAPAEQVQPDPQQQAQEDLLTRVSKFVEEKDPGKSPKDDQGGGQFNSEELNAAIEAIEDPQLKAKIEGLRKSLLSGANDKFQEIATLRKEMQSYLEQTKGRDEWTPARVQELANDPKFIKAAQEVAGVSDTSDEYSALSESEKQNLKAMQAEIENLKKINAQAMQTQQQQLRQQQHTEFSQKYANYDPREIDQITYEMLEGKTRVTPEHIYKAFKHDENVRKAYELGRRDERNGVGDKIASASVEGITASPFEKIEPEKDESSASFFNRIIQKNLKLAKTKS